MRIGFDGWLGVNYDITVPMYTKCTNSENSTIIGPLLEFMQQA